MASDRPKSPTKPNRTAPHRKKPERSRKGPSAPAAIGKRPPKNTDSWLYGRHAVTEALANPARPKRRLLLAAWDESLANRATAAGLVVEQWDRKAFDQRFPGQVHQGIALDCDPLPEPGLEAVLDALPRRATLLILDGVTDPHNVGAILRSAAAFGADAVVTQRRHAPPPTPLLAKTASGALEHVPYVQETNLARALDRIQEADFLTVGLDERGQETLTALPAADRLAVVLGAEGAGLRRLVSAACDRLLRLPTRPPIAALNVSNAAAITLYERTRDA